MLTNLFANRDSKLTRIFAIGDSLSRSLREGVEVFDIKDSKVSYITESKKLISGKLKEDGLEDLEVLSADIFEDPKVFDSFMLEKSTSLTESLKDDDFIGANTAFNDLFEAWNTSIKYSRIQAKLQDKITNLTENSKIISSESFSKLNDLKEGLITWIKENRKILKENEQIMNAIALSNQIKKAFNFPKITYDELSKNGEYTLVTENFKTTYDIVCQQELIKRELLESKEALDSIWVDNKTFQVLVENITSSEDKIEETLAKVISEVPYFAFASKAQIQSIIANKLSISESSVADKEVKTFAAKLFEMKKPVKAELVKVLSEKYGISLNNLKEVPSFKTLIESHVTIFESLSRLAKRSIFKSTLKEFAEFLKTRNGVEILDVNDFVNELFTKSDLAISENSLMQYLDFNRVADDVMKIGAVLKMIQGATQQPQMGMTPGVPLGTVPSPGTSPQIAPPATAPAMASPTPMSGASPMPGAGGSGSVDPMQDQYPNGESDPAMMAAQGAQQDMEGEMQAQGAIPQEPTPMAQGQVVAAMQQLDALLQDLQMQIGRGSGDGAQLPMGGGEEMGGMHQEPDGDEGQFGGEEGEGEFEGGEGEDGEAPEGGEEDDEVEYVDMTGEDEGGEEASEGEEEKAPSTKKPSKDKGSAKPSKSLNKSKPPKK